MAVVLVTGANGQLGKCLQDVAPNYADAAFHFFDRETLPLNEFELVKNVVAEVKPHIIINAAAYTAVDKAETEKEQAFLINGAAVGNLAFAAKSCGARFVHVSTDYVFNGLGTKPYGENDLVSPINAYGASKLEGEKLALENCQQTAVVRTSWVYGKHGNNFVKTMLRLMATKESIGVVSDQIGCPTYAPDLAEALMEIATASNFEAGIFHFSNSGPISWHQFATEIARLSGSKCVVNPIPTSAFPTPAKRPGYSVMSNEKIGKTYGIVQQQWQHSLEKCLKELL